MLLTEHKAMPARVNQREVRDSPFHPRTTMLMASASRAAGGVFEVVRQLSQSLQANAGVNTSVVALRDEHFEEDQQAWRPRRPTAVATLGPRAFGYAPQLNAALQNSQCDLLHVHGLWMYPSIAAIRWHRATRRPYIISPHGMLDPWAIRNSGWKKRIALLLFEARHLRNAACIHALCDDEARAIRAMGLRHCPICIVPNGIHLPEKLSCDTAPPWIKSGDRGRRVLLYLGRLHPKKNLAALLHAWAQARPAGWRLVIAGWDQQDHGEELKRLAGSLGLVNSLESQHDAVSFVGAQFGDAKAACYAHADAFVLPSKSEGLPMAVLEAWGFGMPVLMTPECNLPEGFETGAALRIGTDAAAIGQGLKTFAAMSAESRFTMGARGRDLVTSRFSWSQISQQMAAVYRWILGTGCRPECVV